MIFLPDTNAWIRFLNPGENRVKEHFLTVDPVTMRFCSVVKAELYYGALKSSRSEENLALIEELFANFESLTFDDDAARRYGEIRATLSRQGTPIGPNDLMIASIASVHGAVVVTHNSREFSRVDGLKIEDWET
ncbi:type II toxin-antitoxin system VapC family toxin [Geotalea uraniireducens]|uniref:Ribonuclease VapC n=1 Tax=Geotalea uraniireducens (strain Rf4) TaxID=351605 RepID=A5GAQ0_GEOUR|nr:type II toxin-antitoxin system VapC family toxin [Geotalea uraniireducens]ABQ25342.1 PilT protein domain protein [Geotalea uraniireducens Rf4]